MEKKKRKLVLKKMTVTVLGQTEKLAFGGASRLACSVTACPGTFGCCQPTK